MDGAFTNAPASSAFLGEVLAAIHASGATPIDLTRSVRSISSSGDFGTTAEVTVVFDSGPVVTMTLVAEGQA